MIISKFEFETENKIFHEYQHRSYLVSFDLYFSYLLKISNKALTLYIFVFQSQTSCNSFRCVGSKMVDIQGYPNKMPRSKEETLEQAKDFIHQYYSSINSANKPAHTKRWKEVSSSINKTGTYDLTYDELVFGSKTAWRNAPRCIGRIQWKKLQVDLMLLLFTKQCNESNLITKVKQQWPMLVLGWVIIG